ncbi:hypothetical protein L6452_19188 [Arctium lappa]|uniref:Uncharacterized protein n=1 Tax=Arctium lappa TaxID=4217 RepID=A0ACB9B9Q3_ARCLA|nr:hypothetical protein L6452_19188 [Arctium lappa]
MEVALNEIGVEKTRRGYKPKSMVEFTMAEGLEHMEDRGFVKDEVAERDEEEDCRIGFSSFEETMILRALTGVVSFFPSGPCINVVNSPFIFAFISFLIRISLVSG